jgi:hypothetical protein
LRLIDVNARKSFPIPSPTPTPTPTPVPPKPTISLSVSQAQINEGTEAIITISSSIAVSQPVTVGYLMSGKAKQGTDYTLNPSGAVTIPVGLSV